VNTNSFDNEIDQNEMGDEKVTDQVAADSNIELSDENQNEKHSEDLDEMSEYPENEYDFEDIEVSGYNQKGMNLSDEELDSIADTTIAVIRELLYFFNAEESEIEEYEGDDNELIFDVMGDNLGVLIGRHGITLEALQLMVSSIVSRRIGYYYPVMVDIESYSNRRKEKLISLAKSSAARAIRLQKSVRLRPMSPYERRIVHMSLKDDRRVKTESEGTDPNRQIVIYLTNSK
jgi:spoIIIJ-associated protein